MGGSLRGCHQLWLLPHPVPCPQAFGPGKGDAQLADVGADLLSMRISENNPAGTKKAPAANAMITTARGMRVSNRSIGFFTPSPICLEAHFDPRGRGRIAQEPCLAPLAMVLLQLS